MVKFVVINLPILVFLLFKGWRAQLVFKMKLAHLFNNHLRDGASSQSMPTSVNKL